MNVEHYGLDATPLMEPNATHSRKVVNTNNTGFFQRLPRETPDYKRNVVIAPNALGILSQRELIEDCRQAAYVQDRRYEAKLSKAWFNCFVNLFLICDTEKIDWTVIEEWDEELREVVNRWDLRLMSRVDKSGRPLDSSHPIFQNHRTFWKYFGATYNQDSLKGFLNTDCGWPLTEKSSVSGRCLRASTFRLMLHGMLEKDAISEVAAGWALIQIHRVRLMADVRLSARAWVFKEGRPDFDGKRFDLHVERRAAVQGADRKWSAAIILDVRSEALGEAERRYARALWEKEQALIGAYLQWRLSWYVEPSGKRVVVPHSRPQFAGF